MAGLEERPPFEILEHTADVGLRVRGTSLEQLFENAIAGLIEIVGARAEEGDREEHLSVELDENDPGRALVDLLNEVIFLLDRHQARVARATVSRADRSIVATIRWEPASTPPEGTELKATTYHQLNVERSAEGYRAAVFFDV